MASSPPPSTCSIRSNGVAGQDMSEAGASM
jgi:hypothetical protein